MTKATYKHQAVILIHGIGEQHPIVTLRDFVEAITAQLKKDRKAGENEAVFWDKPDPVSGNYETRKMVMRAGEKHPTTDFFEFYWAHHLRDTNWSHIKDWLQRVVWRSPFKVSKRLLSVFFFLWISFFTVAAVICVLINKIGFTNFTDSFKTISSSLLAVFLLGKFSQLLFNYLGDAARYLDPSPGNISERQAIREEGIKFLKNLHESKKYDRIILVSHSLGSTIAYDLIKILWNEYNKSFDTEKLTNRVNGSGNKTLEQVTASEESARQLDKKVDNELAEFRVAQQKSYEYLKFIGNKWLITDLLTIGSPLAHAGHLFAQQDQLFEKLKEQREYPTCPPRLQKGEKTNILPVEGARPDRPLYFNHSSPFAVTKWTNIYYSSDFVGGPLINVFGKGIRDIEIKKRNWFFIYPKGHTEYWKFSNEKNVLNEIWNVLKND